MAAVLQNLRIGASRNSLKCNMKKKRRKSAWAPKRCNRYLSNVLFIVLESFWAKPRPQKIRDLCALAFQLSCLTRDIGNNIQHVCGLAGVVTQISCKFVLILIKKKVFDKGRAQEHLRNLHIGTSSSFFNTRYEKKRQKSTQLLKCWRSD